MLFVGYDRTIKQWDLDDMAMRHDYLRSQCSSVTRGDRLEYQAVGTILLVDSDTLFTCIDNGAPRIWNIKTGTFKAQLPGEAIKPRTAAISSNRNTIMAVDPIQQSVYAWNLDDFKQVELSNLEKSKALFVHYEPNQNQFYMVSTLSQDMMTVHMVNADNLSVVKCVKVRGCTKEISICVVTDNGNYMVLLFDPVMDPNGCIEYRGGHLQLNGSTEVDLVFMSTTMYCATCFEDDLVLIGVMGKF